MKSTYFKIALVAFAVIIFAACKKVAEGFISDTLYYKENPLITSQGATTVSAPLEVDGSTSPMTVKLTKVVDQDGNSVDSLMAKSESIPGFTGSVSYVDSTLELLNKKIAFTTAKPLTVNPTGGRIQLTPATKFVPPGTYTIDVEVSNVRGTKTLTKACQIVIGATGSPDTLFGGTYAGTFDITTGVFLGGLAEPTVTVTHTPTTDNKIIYKFIDQNGQLYNAQAGGIGTRTNRWNMKQFDPYYPEVLTTTGVEYEFPVVPGQFPVFTNPTAFARGQYGVFYAIPQAHNSTGSPVFVFLDIAFLTQGTFTITSTFHDVSWK